MSLAKLLPAVVTGNDLMNGDAIWRDASGGWTLSASEAAIFQDAESAETALAAAKAEPHLVVGPYLVKTAIVDGRAAPEHYRERIRSLGPTFRTDLGKQAERAA